MLEAVGHPVAVNPDRDLRRVSSERGWQVRDFRRPVRLRERLPSVPRPDSGALRLVAGGAALAALAAFALWFLARERAERQD
jgi:hypothetical protein